MRKFFAAVCLIGFVVLAPLVIPASIIQARVFTPTSFKQLVRRAQLGERLPQITASFLASQAEAEGQTAADTFSQFGGESLFEQALTSVFPASDVYVILDAVIDQGFIWWHSGQPIEDLNIAIDLSKAKQRLAPIVLDTITNQLDHLPVCTADQLQQIQDQSGGDLFSMTCKPAGFSLDALQQAGFSTDQLTQSVLSSVPDQFDVHTFFNQMAQSDPQQLASVNRTLDTARQTLAAVVLVLRILQIISVICFLMVGLLRLVPLRAFFTWLAWMLFIPGLEIGIIAGGLTFIPSLIEQQISAAYPEVVGLIPITAVIQFVIRAFSVTTLWVGVGMAATGVILFIVSRFLKRPQPKTVSPPISPVPTKVMSSGVPASNTPLPATQRTPRTTKKPNK